jgi:hypothetical protein
LAVRVHVVVFSPLSGRLVIADGPDSSVSLAPRITVLVCLSVPFAVAIALIVLGKRFGARSRWSYPTTNQCNAQQNWHREFHLLVLLLKSGDWRE